MAHDASLIEHATTGSANRPLPTFAHLRHHPSWKRKRNWAWGGLLFVAFLYGALFALLPPAYLPPLLLPLGLAALLVVWALPSGTRAPTRLVYWLFLAFFVALMAWPTYLAIAIPGLPWISLIRIFGFPLVLVLLICLSISEAVRTDIKVVLSETPAVWKLLVLFVGIQLFAVAFSEQPYISFQKFIINQVYWTGIFFSACYVFRCHGRVTTWAVLLWLLALFVCAIGFWEWRLGRLPWAGHIPSIFKIDDEAVARILAGTARAATGIYRVQATSTTSLSLAEFLALATPFLIYFLVEVQKLWVRVASVLSLGVMFFTIYNTNARLGALGFFLSFLLYLGLWAVRRWRSVRSSIFGPAITLAYPAIVILFFTATLFIGRLHRMVWGGGEHQFSTDARMLQLEMGLPMVIGNPFGHGAGQAAAVLGYMDLNGLLTIDNYLLSIALEYGVLGFIAYFSMFGAGVWYGLREIMRPASDPDSKFILPITVALIVFLVIKTVLSQEANHPIAFMLLGILSALIYRNSRGLPSTSSR